MSDKEFNALLMRVYNANMKYRDLLKKAEEEYEARFGYNPSEVDDDYWVDSFHQGNSGFSFKEVIENGILSAGIKE